MEFLNHSDDYWKRTVQYFNEGLAAEAAEKGSVSGGVSRAFASLFGQQDDAFYAPLFDDNLDAAATLGKVNAIEASRRAPTNYAPFNEAHHIYGLGIQAKPLQAIARAGDWEKLRDIRLGLNEMGIKGGTTANLDRLTSLDRKTHVQFGHAGDTYTSFFLNEFDPGIEVKDAVQQLSEQVDQQVLASAQGAESKIAARQRKFIMEWTGVDPRGNPSGAKKALNEMGIKAPDLNKAVLDSLTPVEQMQTVLEGRLPDTSPAGIRRAIMDGTMDRIFNNPSFYSGLPFDGKAMLAATKRYFQGEVAGATYGAFLDPDSRAAVERGDGKGVVKAVAKDTALGAVGQAVGSRVLPAVARVAPKAAAAFGTAGALAAPVALAGSLGGSVDSKIQERRRQEMLRKMDAERRRKAELQIAKDKAAAAKPLIDGDAIVKKLGNDLRYEGKRLLKIFGM